MERVHLVVVGEQGPGLELAALRYGLLERMAKAADRQEVAVVAFGFDADGVRLVLDGPRRAVTNVVRAIRVGTAREAKGWDRPIQWAPTWRDEVDEVLSAVVWAHRGPLLAGADDPLASPWSSHRDLLGLRKATFYDAQTGRDHVEARAVHALLGGSPLPEPTEDVGRPPLARLLRIAAALQGRLPADRRTFRLFVHLGRAVGWPTHELAEALMLTGRRIRQLSEGSEPLLPVAMVHLSDERLVVP